MAIIGMTGSGKSVLMSSLLAHTRKQYIVLKSKADSVEYPKARTVTAARQLDPYRTTRYVLRPEFERQHDEFLAALQQVWTEGGWTVAVDELYYLDAELKLRVPINRLLTQGREPGRISVCCGMQRPSAVTRFAIGEATHVISFKVEGRDAQILRDATNRTFSDLCVTLPRHHFAWLDVAHGHLWTGSINLDTGRYIGRSIA